MRIGSRLLPDGRIALSFNGQGKVGAHYQPVFCGHWACPNHQDAQGFCKVHRSRQLHHGNPYTFKIRINGKFAPTYQLPSG